MVDPRKLVPEYPRREKPEEPATPAQRAKPPPHNRRCSIANCANLVVREYTKVERGMVLGETFYACDNRSHQDALEAKLDGYPDPRLPWHLYMKALGHDVPEPPKPPPRPRPIGPKKPPPKGRKRSGIGGRRGRFT